MGLYWVIYKDGETASVFISEASSLLQANMKAGVSGAPGKFAEGHLLDKTTAEKVPKDLRGVVLSHEEALDLLEELG